VEEALREGRKKSSKFDGAGRALDLGRERGEGLKDSDSERMK